MIKFSGKKLKELREQHGLSVRQLSYETSIGRTSISRYENDQRAPSIEVAGRFAEYFDCPFESFLEKVVDE